MSLITWILNGKISVCFHELSLYFDDWRFWKCFKFYIKSQPCKIAKVLNRSIYQWYVKVIGTCVCNKSISCMVIWKLFKATISKFHGVSFSVNCNHFRFQTERHVKVPTTILFYNNFPTKWYVACLNLFTSLCVNFVQNLLTDW